MTHNRKGESIYSGEVRKGEVDEKIEKGFFLLCKL